MSIGKYEKYSLPFGILMRYVYMKKIKLNVKNKSYFFNRKHRKNI